MVNEKMMDYGKRRNYIRELFEYGREQKKIVGEENVFDFSLGNPSVPPPQEISDALMDVAMNETPIQVHGYTSSAGSDDARDAITAHISRVTGHRFSRRNIFLTCGAAAALMACFKGFRIDRDTEFLVVAPFFAEYKWFVEGVNARLTVVPPQIPDFQINLEALEERLNPNTQAVVINTPNNPSGAVYTEETIRRLAEILKRKSREFGHVIYLISDEPYRELVYDDINVPFIPDFYPNTIICYSYSKSLSLPGDRIGYMFVPDEMENFDEVCWATAGAARALGYVCAPAIMQRVIARCADVPTNLSAYDRNRKLLYGGLTAMGYECCHPDGAFYLFIQAPNGYSSMEFSNLAREKNLLLVPGDDFECPGYLRASYCVSYDMIQRSLSVFRKLMEDTRDN